MSNLFSTILSNGKDIAGDTPPVDAPPEQEVKEGTKSRLPVDDQGNPKPRHRRTQAEMAAARGEVQPLAVKIVCPHDDVPDMPAGTGMPRPGIQVNEAYPMIVRMLGENKDMIIMYLRALVIKSVYAQDQRSKEEYKYMREYYKMEVIS